MDALVGLFLNSLLQVWVSFTHNWPYLAASILIAAGLKRYLDPQKVSAFLARHQRVGVWGATAAAVGTPLCSCGTTAVLLGMLATQMPWAPIIAFMVASPLTSPEGLFYSAGLFGWPFALAFFIASIFLGLLGGLAGEILERRGWLKDQSRYVVSPRAEARSGPEVECSCRPQPQRLAVSCCAAAAVPGGTAVHASNLLSVWPIVQAAYSGCSCAGPSPEAAPQARAGLSPRPAQPAPAPFFAGVLEIGKRLLPLFFGFAFIGYFLNGLIPADWVSSIFGQGRAYSVPLAASLGLPLYINTEASLPLVRGLIGGGMSQGAALAFLITGAGTSVGAVTGALAIARWRVIALVVGILWIGAVAAGFSYNLLLAMRLF